MYEDELVVLRRTNVDKIDWFPTLRGRTRYRNNSLGRNLTYSQVGPYFGPTSYR